MHFLLSLKDANKLVKAGPVPFETRTPFFICNPKKLFTGTRYSLLLLTAGILVCTAVILVCTAVTSGCLEHEFITSKDDWGNF